MVEERIILAQEKLVYSVKEAARLLGVSDNHAYELVRQNILPSQRLGKKIVIPKGRLAKFLEG
ncbi:MAG: helix-turn-helix domain-containing protein [Dehalogenimonas sp.]